MRQTGLIFFALILMSISTTSLAQQKKSVSQLDEISLQLVWHHQFQFAGYYAANIKGFYEEEGLSVNLLEGGAFANVSRKVAQGIADFGISDTELLVEYANGKSFVALDAVFQNSPSVFAVKQNSGIQSLADIASSTVMVDSLYGLIELKAILSKENIPDNNLKVFEGPYSFDEFLRNDSIQVLHCFITIDVPEMRANGIDLKVFSPQMYGIDFYGDILFTNNRFLQQNPNVVERFRRANKKGWEYARNNQQEMVDYILTLPGVKERGMNNALLNIEADRMWEFSIPEVVPHGYMNKDRWEKIASYYADAGLIDENISLDDFLITAEESLIDQLIPTLKYIIAGLILLILSAIFWFYMLRKEVKNRTNLWIKEFKERQQTAKKLQKTERDFKALVENIHDCVFCMDGEAVFTYISPNVEQITGYTPEEVLNVKYAPFFPEETLEDLFGRYRTRIESGQDDNLAIEIVHKNGTKKWVSATTKVFEHPVEGTLVQGTFRDVTDKVRTQHALHYSEERFRKLTEQSPVGIYILSGDQYIYVNSRYASIFAAEPKEFIGEKIDPKYIHSEDLPVLTKNIQKLMAGEIEKTDSLYRAFNKHGDEIHIHFYSSIIEVDNERLLFGTALEVTDQISTQKALKEQEEQLRIITEKSFTGLVLVQNGDIKYINPRYLEILGFERHEIKTQEDLFKLTHPDDIESVRTSVADRNKGIIDHVHYQCRMYHKKGHLVHLDIYGSVVTINGEDAIMASIMDITDSVRAKNKLEASVHEKNVLLAEIHHRVKNNMAVVSGLMELQKFKTKDETTRSLLKESQLRIKTIAMIHEKLYQSDSFSEIPFGDYIADLIKNIAQSLYQESVNIKVTEEYDNISLNINQAIPAALFTNEVVTNCFKHAFPNGREGEINIKIKQEKDRKVRISISDNGVGLPDDRNDKESLGMTLIKNLSNQVNAELSIKNGNGCGFEILFKKENRSGSAAAADIS